MDQLFLILNFYLLSDGCTILFFLLQFLGDEDVPEEETSEGEDRDEL